MGVAMERRLGMQVVRVEREKVLERMRENRAQHRAIFEAAIEGYRQRVIEVLDQMIADARAGRRIRQNVGLPEPADHTDDYDLVIDMLELEVEDVIELTQAEFAQYVRDDWGWKGQFYAQTTGAGYVGDQGDYPGAGR
jgi:hypothetical protein